MNLGVEFLKPGEEKTKNVIALGTFYDNEIHTLGLIELSLQNIQKFRNFKYTYLVKNENGEWTPSKEQLQMIIPREFEENELIGGFANNEEEIEF